jgi:hypothetical protein
MMRLSEAIRLGAMLKPQYHGDLWSGDGRRSCAYGAALDAIGRGHACRVARELPPAWLELGARPETCPACQIAMPATSVVTHLNDKHEWTRERIADWLEPIERAMPPALAIDVACLPQAG